MAQELIRRLGVADEDIQSFFLPDDGPDFCIGCNTCFFQGEEHCPYADKASSIALAMDEADLIVLASPLYTMGMSGGMKNLMDHYAYRWMVHRPQEGMFRKVGVVISSSAGAPTGGATKALKRQMKLWGVARVYRFGLTAQMAPNAQSMKPSIQGKMERKAARVAEKVQSSLQNPHPGVLT